MDNVYNTRPKFTLSYQLYIFYDKLTLIEKVRHLKHLGNTTHRCRFEVIASKITSELEKKIQVIDLHLIVNPTVQYNITLHLQLRNILHFNSIQCVFERVKNL